MTKTDEAMFARTEKKFNVRLKDTVSEVRAEEPQDQDWDRIRTLFNQYGAYLELFPEAAQPAESEQMDTPENDADAGENEEK